MSCWVSANAETKLNQQNVKVNLTLLVSQIHTVGDRITVQWMLSEISVHSDFTVFLVSTSSFRWSVRRSTC